MKNNNIYVVAPTLRIASLEIDKFCREFKEYVLKHNKSKTILKDGTQLIPISISCRIDGLRIDKEIRADCLLKECYKYKSNLLQERIDKTLKQIEHIRQYFSEDLQPDFVLLEEILEGKQGVLL